MRYMLMLYADEKAGAEIPPENMARVMQAMGAYHAALEKAGAFVATAGLMPTGSARTLRIEGGEITLRADGAYVNETGEMKVHDGPYADTREQLGGYFVIEAPDMAGAIEWARQCPAAQWGSIEIRPCHPDYAP